MEVKDCILKYNFKEIKPLVEKALESGEKPGRILDEGMISAMSEVGTGFKENRVFMPQMLVAAKTMQSGLEVLKPHLQGDANAPKAGNAIVGSVLGDVHDIGKNLVSIMMEGAGFEITDLGVDVPREKFLEALKDKPDTRFIACSSTMTPTRDALRDIVAGIKGSDLGKDVTVMVGGATMDQQFCDEIGADIYTADAASAADYAKQIASGRDREEVKAESAAIAMARLNPAPVAEATEETHSDENARHAMKAPYLTAGRGDSGPLSIKDNLAETLKHERGCPDRYVKQFEYFDLVYDPIITNSMGLNKVVPGVEFKDGWGITQVMPVGSGGPHPIHGPGKTVITDIRKWEEQLKPARLDFPEADWEALRPQIKAVEDAGRHVATWMATGIFEKVHCLMGMQEALVAYYENPEEMHGLIDAITEWELQSLERTMENVGPTVLFHHDDWGTALNSFLDTDTHRRFFEEPYRKVYGRFRELGGEIVVHHSDCYCANLVPMMIDVGIDVWQGATEANDIPSVIDRYGDRITVMGGIDDGAVDVPEWTRESVSGYVRGKCAENGVVSFIPCLTRGRGRSIYPGIYDTISETLDEISEVSFRGGA